MDGPIPGVGGIVLCGGKSSRMGRPKAWLSFGGETLLQRVVRVLGEVVAPVVVVATADQELPELPASILVTRDEREFLGPLNGLVAGLHALTGQVDAAYLSSCDVPFLQTGFVRRVVERLGDLQISLPEIGGFKHPLAAVYRVDVLPVAIELVSAGRLRPTFLTDRVPTRLLTASDFADVDPSFQSLRNLNTPGEYEEALREAGHGPVAPE